MDALKARSGIAAVDAYLAAAIMSVVGMSSQFAAGICCGLLRIQTAAGVKGPVVEVGAFEGRFLIALAKALAPGEVVLGIDLFDWPNPEVEQRCIANCDKHGVPKAARIIWKTDSRKLTPRRCWPSSAANGRGCSTSTANIRGRCCRTISSLPPP